MPTIDELYWDNRYKQEKTGWNIGYASEPICSYVNQIENKDIRILIPGCGNAYEATYLLSKGFKNIHLIDISDNLINTLKEKFKLEIKEGLIKVEKKDFFELDEKYDLIIEQTFFCAIGPEHRLNYVKKMNSLLKNGGKLVGVIFNFEFNENGPPFGGNKNEYELMFNPNFKILTMEKCYNSIKPREGKELFIILQIP
jgi:thiopurine S-methyltransferase